MADFQMQNAESWGWPAAVLASQAERQPIGREEVGLEEVVYSIRLPSPPQRISCHQCRRRFRAAGPTGHANGEPICDHCFLGATEELGMVLALISVVRLFAGTSYPSNAEYWESLALVGAFSRIYERTAIRSGPPRIFQPSIKFS